MMRFVCSPSAKLAHSSCNATRVMSWGAEGEDGVFGRKKEERRVGRLDDGWRGAGWEWWSRGRKKSAANSFKATYLIVIEPFISMCSLRSECVFVLYGSSLALISSSTYSEVYMRAFRNTKEETHTYLTDVWHIAAN